MNKQENTTDLDLQRGPYRTTYTGLEIIGESTQEQWQSYGEILRRVDEAKQWAIGDWLVDGKRHYGDKLYERASSVLGLEEDWLRKLKSISDRYELCTRVHNVSWKHYQEVSSIKRISENEDGGKLSLSDDTDYEKIENLLETAEKEKLSVRAIRDLVAEHKRNQQRQIQLANEPSKYQVIYIDPPWPVGSVTMDKWQSPIEDKYPTMTIEEIKALPIKRIAYDDCAMFMWTTHSFLPDALDLFKAWGFKYFCTITWDKGGGWTQNGFHKRTEFLLYAYKGNMNVDQFGEAIPTIIYEQKTEHSKKPDSIRKLIESKTPDSRIEIFARGHFEGWDVWGNEV